MSATIDRDAVERTIPGIVEWRRYLHAHPEVSYNEHATAEWIEAKLREFGITTTSRPTPTSVIATLASGSPGRVLALRADIDALPITEANEHEFVSTVPGVMHACGHDGHAAILLGVAKLLSESGGPAAGEVRLIFQHAEEHAPGGARELVDAGVLSAVDAVFGLHIWLGTDVGTVNVTSGPFMAGLDVLEIELRGRGGHGAEPHKTIDPIVAAGALITSLQSVVARNVDPSDSAVVSLTEVHGGDAYNVIPETVRLRGAVRTRSPESAEAVCRRVDEIVRGIAHAHGVDAEVTWLPGYSPVVNDPDLSEAVLATLAKEFGAEAVQTGLTTMGSEDFSGYQTVVPGVFIFVGGRNEARGINYPHHHPRFDFDEAALSDGVRVFLAILEENGIV